MLPKPASLCRIEVLAIVVGDSSGAVIELLKSLRTPRVVVLGTRNITQRVHYHTDGAWDESHRVLDSCYDVACPTN